MAESLHRYIVGRSGNGIDGAWNIVEPHTTFIDGWHLHAMAEHLEAISRGQIRNLIINVPPRHAKSLIVSVFWMTWEWVNNPWKQWIFSSYSDHLSIRDSIKCRRIFASDWFQYHFGNIFRIVPDQDTKKKFENDHGGHRLATGVGGLATGEGAHIVCLPYDTLIQTEQGGLSIGDIVENRLPVQVVTFNHDAGVVEYSPIAAYETNPGRPLVEIDLGDRTLTCTEDHPVYVEGKGYIAAGTLEPGDVVITFD